MKELLNNIDNTPILSILMVSVVCLVLAEVLSRIIKNINN